MKKGRKKNVWEILYDFTVELMVILALGGLAVLTLIIWLVLSSIHT